MNGLSETRPNACLPIRCKACLFHSHFIGADSKLLCSKETLLISCYSSRLIGQRIVQRNFLLRNNTAAGVAHNALKSCSNYRRLSGSANRAKQQSKPCDNPESNMAHGKRTASQSHLESPSPISGGRTKATCLGRAPRTPHHGAVHRRTYSPASF